MSRISDRCRPRVHRFWSALTTAQRRKAEKLGHTHHEGRCGDHLARLSERFVGHSNDRGRPRVLLGYRGECPVFTDYATQTGPSALSPQSRTDFTVEASHSGKLPQVAVYDNKPAATCNRRPTGRDSS
jgi:hypothetical protein